MGEYLIGVSDLNLKDTFECGQCFRWNANDDGSYTGVVTTGRESRAARLSLEERADGTFLRIVESDPDGCWEGEGAADHEPAGSGDSGSVCDPDGEARWRRYLDLDRDYGAIKKTLSAGDEKMRTAIGTGAGIRILNQDNFETLISFIISQNNNIPRIKKCIDFLCQLYGEELGVFDGLMRQGFPSPERLAHLTPQELAPLHLGYRDTYIIDAAKKVAEDGGEALSHLADMSYAEAFSYVSGIRGVGPKVANCVLLFAGQHFEAFPVDVWVKRVMTEIYGISDRKEIEAFAEKNFGDLSGFAQQYLFNYMRNLPAVSL